MAVSHFSSPPWIAEFDLDRIVATLSQSGVSYISVQEGAEPYPSLPAAQLLAALLESKDARIEYAVVALLIRHPEYAQDVLRLTNTMPSEQAAVLKRHYTAAVYLQRMYWPALSIYLGPMAELPDHFSARLGLPPADEYYGEAGLRALIDRLPPPIDWWHTYLDPLQMLIRTLSLEKTYGWQTD